MAETEKLEGTKERRACCSCGGARLLISISPVMYRAAGPKDHTQGIGRRVVVCEACLFLSVLGTPGRPEREKVSEALYQSLSGVYKRVAGVSA